jgi:NagD protein
MPNWTYLMDMDGVLVHEEHLVPGADKLIAELTGNGTPFLVLTNNSIYTPRDLRGSWIPSVPTDPRSSSARPG